MKWYSKTLFDGFIFFLDMEMFYTKKMTIYIFVSHSVIKKKERPNNIKYSIFCMFNRNVILFSLETRTCRVRIS